MRLRVVNQSRSRTSSLRLNAKHMSVCVAVATSSHSTCGSWPSSYRRRPHARNTCQQLAGTAPVFTRLHYKAQTAALHTVSQFCPRVKLPFHNFHYSWSWGRGGKKGLCDAPRDRGSCFSFAAFHDLHSDGLFQPRFSKTQVASLRSCASISTHGGDDEWQILLCGVLAWRHLSPAPSAEGA